MQAFVLKKKFSRKKDMTYFFIKLYFTEEIIDMFPKWVYDVDTK